MARNRGKRLGAASGSSSPSQGQARDAEVKAGDVSTGGQTDHKAPAAASASIAAKVGAPTAGAGTTTSAAKPSSEASKPASSTTSTATKPTAASTSAASSTQTSHTAKPSSAATSGGTAAAGSSGGQHGGPSSDGGSGGFWLGLIGGVIGGAATALAASLFWMDGDDTATTELESRLSAAEQQVEQIGALNDRVATVEAAPAASSSDQDGDMTARLAELEAKLAELDSLSSGGASGDGTDDGLGERLTSLEQQFETLAGEVQTVGDTQQANLQALSSLQNTLPTLEAILAATGVTVGQTSEQTTALNQNVETLAVRVGDAESRLDHLGGEYQRGAAMIVAIGDINRAVTRAEPFDGSLQTLKSLVRDDAALGETLSTLEPIAADGVPTLKGLKDAFGQMASRVLLAEEGDQSLTDQVGNNVFGIFNMRPAGANVEGSGSRAILARAQSKLSADDLDGAILELGGLEGQSAEEATAWIERAGARLAAEAAVVDLRAHAQGLVAKGS